MCGFLQLFPGLFSLGSLFILPQMTDGQLEYIAQFPFPKTKLYTLLWTQIQSFLANDSLLSIQNHPCLIPQKACAFISGNKIQSAWCSWLTHSRICAFFFRLNNTFCQCFYCPIKPIFRETFVTHSVPAKHCNAPWVRVSNRVYPLHTLNRRRHYDLSLFASFRSPWTFSKTVFC